MTEQVINLVYDEFVELLVTKQYSLVNINIGDEIPPRLRLPQESYQKWRAWAVNATMKYHNCGQHIADKFVDLVEFTYGIPEFYIFESKLPDRLDNLIIQHVEQKKINKLKNEE